MPIGSPFDGGPDPELGAALRGLLTPGDDAAFAVRVLARLEPGSPWEVLAQWARPGLAAAVVLLTPLPGAAVGSAVTVRQLGHRFGWDAGHHHGAEGYVLLLDHELDLTGPQRDSVAAILRRHTSDMDSVWAVVGPRMDTMREAIRAEIRQQLTAEQQARYAEVVRRIDADRDERERTEDRDTE